MADSREEVWSIYDQMLHMRTSKVAESNNENLSGEDEYGQIFDEPPDDVDGDGDHHLAIDHPEAINVERDGKKQQAEETEDNQLFGQTHSTDDAIGPAHASSPDQVLQDLVAEAKYEAIKEAIKMEWIRENSVARNVAEEIEETTEDEEVLDPNVQDLNRICKEAYMEFMRMAGGIYIRQKPDPVGMGVEVIGHMKDVPVAADILVSTMMDVDKWASSMSDIVCRASASHLPGKRILVDAEVRLPTPLVKTRKFCFLRFSEFVSPDIWVIVDVSNDWLQPGSKLEQRTSGVIIKRGDEGNSKVIWFDNVEVYQCLENNIYSTVLNSKLAFCAKHWLTTLSQKMHRNASRFDMLEMNGDEGARFYLLELCTRMKNIFLECTHEYPDEKKYTVLSDEEGKRILSTTLESDSYVGLTSFHVKAKLNPTFTYLIRKDIELEWPNLRNQEEPEAMIKLASKNDSNCITVYRRLVSEDDSPKVYEAIVQEISRNDFCSYVISSPMNLGDFDNAFCSGIWKDIPIQPSGFAIMPDGSRGLQSDASLVTVVAHKHVAEADRPIDIMTGVVTTTMKDIEEAVSNDVSDKGDRDSNEGDRDSNETS